MHLLSKLNFFCERKKNLCKKFPQRIFLYGKFEQKQIMQLDNLPSPKKLFPVSVVLLPLDGMLQNVYRIASQIDYPTLPPNISYSWVERGTVRIKWSFQMTHFLNEPWHLDWEPSALPLRLSCLRSQNSFQIPLSQCCQK